MIFNYTGAQLFGLRMCVFDLGEGGIVCHVLTLFIPLGLDSLACFSDPHPALPLPSCLPSAAFFLGGGPELRSDEPIFSSEQRQRLRTQTTGRVLIRIGVMLRNFDKFGVEVT